MASPRYNPDSSHYGSNFASYSPTSPFYNPINQSPIYDETNSSSSNHFSTPTVLDSPIGAATADIDDDRESNLAHTEQMRPGG